MIRKNEFTIEQFFEVEQNYKQEFKRKKETVARGFYILRLRNKGHSLSFIAKLFGKSPERIRQMEGTFLQQCREYYAQIKNNK